MSAQQLYKITGPNGEPLHGGSGDWPLPTDTEPGAWREVSAPVIPCRNGLHLTTAADMTVWLPVGDCRIWRTEYAGEVIPGGNKYAVERARLLPGPIDGQDVRAALVPDRIPMPRRPALAYMRLPKGHILTERIEQARTAYETARKRHEASVQHAERARVRRLAALFPEVTK